MSHLGHYTDSACADNPQESARDDRKTLPRVGDWRSIGEVLARQIAPEVVRRVRKRMEGGK